MDSRFNAMTPNSLLFGRDLSKGTRAVRSYRDRDEGFAFTTGIRFNQELDFLEVLSFWAEGVGAAAFLAALLTNNVLLAAGGLLFVVVAVVALLAHLGRAGRSWRVPAALKTAWVSRGPIIIAGLASSGTVWMYLSHTGTPGLYRSLALVVSFAFAILLMFYAGWLLGSMKAVKLWNGRLFPLTFVAHSVASGMVVLACLDWTGAIDTGYGLGVSQMALASLVFCLVLTAAHLRRPTGSLAVQASLDRLSGGSLKAMFLGAVFLGIVVPFALIAAFAWWRDLIVHGLAVAMAVVAVAGRLAGDLAYRYAVVRAGAYEPIL